MNNIKYILHDSKNHKAITRVEFTREYKVRDFADKCTYQFGGRYVPPCGALTFDNLEDAENYKNNNNIIGYDIIKYDVCCNEIIGD